MKFKVKEYTALGEAELLQLLSTEIKLTKFYSSIKPVLLKCVKHSKIFSWEFQNLGWLFPYLHREKTILVKPKGHAAFLIKVYLPFSISNNG